MFVVFLIHIPREVILYKLEASILNFECTELDNSLPIVVFFMFVQQSDMDQAFSLKYISLQIKKVCKSIPHEN